MTWTPAYVLGEERDSRWLIICDHATNLVPPGVKHGDLGVSGDDMTRHIAYDVGAAGVTVRLAERLGAPAVLSNFSRLVIDPNRGEDDPTLVMRLYDGTIVPGNRCVDRAEIERRLNLCYRPYHTLVERMAARRDDTVILSIHSFTPQLRGRPARAWHIGLLHAADRRLTFALLDLLREEPGIVAGANVPYSGFLAGDTIDRHAIRHGRQNTLVEIRNDLIADEGGQADWADRLARLLPPALAAAETEEI